MSARRLSHIGPLLWLIATPLAVGAAVMANYSDLPSETQLAWLCSAVLLTLAGALAQVLNGVLPGAYIKNG
jgi:hypothetical protein